MNTEILTEELRNLSTESYIWKFGIYSIQKTRDGLEMEWNLCNIEDIAKQIELIREHLLKKPVSDKPVAQYSPFLSDKESIGAMENTDDMIKEQYTDIIINIRNAQCYPPNDFISGDMPKITGYAFFGERNEDSGDSGEACEPVLLMRRGNPFLTGARFYTGEAGELIPEGTALLKLTTAVDFLAIGGVCYFLASSIEKDFAFENRHFAIAKKCLDKIVDMEIIGDYDSFERVVMTSKNARKFLDFDEEVLDYIKRLPIVERTDFLEKYGVVTDRNGRMATFDAEQCGFVIDLLCSRSSIDPLGRLSVGNKITPRE